MAINHYCPLNQWSTAIRQWEPGLWPPGKRPCNGNALLLTCRKTPGFLRKVFIDGRFSMGNHPIGFGQNTPFRRNNVEQGHKGQGCLQMRPCAFPDFVHLRVFSSSFRAFSKAASKFWKYSPFMTVLGYLFCFSKKYFLSNISLSSLNIGLSTLRRCLPFSNLVIQLVEQFFVTDFVISGWNPDEVIKSRRIVTLVGFSCLVQWEALRTCSILFSNRSC